jgi:hypothetical protein
MKTLFKTTSLSLKTLNDGAQKMKTSKIAKLHLELTYGFCNKHHKLAPNLDDL